MDQNESNNKRGLNTFADDIDRSSTLTELERIGARASRKGIQRTQLEERIKAEGKLLNSLLDEGRKTPEFRGSPFYQEQTQSLRENIRGIRGKMNTLDTTARTRAESEASTYISRQFATSAIGGEVSTLQKEANIQNRGMAMSGRTYDELSARRQEILADVRVRERNAQNEVKGMFSGRGQVDPEKSAALGVMMGGAQDHFRELAAINAAQAYQRAGGADPNSKMKNLAEMGKEATSILSSESVAQEMKSGGVQIAQGGKLGTVANEDISKEIVNQARVLSQALKELADGASKTDEELAKFRESADESANNLKKLQDAQKMGGGSGGFNGVNFAMGLAGGFNALGGAAQQILVNQRMQETANIGGFANLANQQYDMYAKARGGDIASQLALGQFEEADKFGTEMKRGTNVAQSAFMVAGTAQAAAGTLQAANAAKNMGVTLGLTGSQEFMGGVQNAVQGVATTAVTSADMAKGVSAQQARLAGIQANMQARQAINYVGAKQAQGLRNFYTDLDVSAQELGGGANQFLAEATGRDNLERMKEARLSPEQFAKLSQQAGAGMGSTFSSGSIFQARELERAGFGSAQTNIQRMSTLSAAGGNNPQASMQGVLEAAFTKSLDSSKVLNMMVDNTAAMAAGTSAAAAGIDVTGAAATMLATGANPNMANKEAALQQAIQASQITAGITTNRSATFSGMVNTAAITERTGVSGVEAIIAQGLTIQEYKALQGNPRKAAEFYKDQGINVGEDKAESFTKEMLRQKQIQIIRDKGMALNIKDVPGMVDRVMAGTETKDDKILFNQAMSLSGYKGGDQGRREIMGVTAQNTQEGVNKAMEAVSGGKEDDLKRQLDNLRTSGFKQLTEAADAAAKKLENFGGALKVFTDLQNKFESGGARTEDEFSTAGAKFAETFSASTGLFNTSVTNFERAVQKFSDNAGLRSNAMPAIPNDLTDKLNQLQGSQKGR